MSLRYFAVLPQGKKIMCLWMVLLKWKKVGITTKSMMRTRMLRIMMARGDLYETKDVVVK